MVLLLSCK